MSYILEALKRSEQERQHQLRPGSLDLDGGIIHLRQRRTPVWVYVLAAVLVLNLGLMLTLYWDKFSTPLTVPLNETSAVIQRTPVHEIQKIKVPMIEMPAATVMPSTANRAITLSENNRDEQSAEYERTVSTASAQYADAESYTYIQPKAATEPEQPTELALENGIVSDETEAWDIVAPVSEASRSQAPTPLEAPLQSETMDEPPVEIETARPSKLVDSTPLLQAMEAEFTSSVPPIGFNSHIFSKAPSARRVMINNIYLREGEGFSGINVVEIGEQYVVFDKQGRHFKLPVMKDWNP